VAAIRWWIARDRVVFHLSPDEPGQLAIARFLGGGTVWRMFDHSTRSPGYALVLAPVHWFTDDPATTFRAALALNALLGGVAVGLLCLLTRRTTGLSGRACVVVATVAALVPGALFVTEWTWTESLVPVVVVLTVLALMWFVDQPTILRGAAAAGAAAAAHLTHNRLLPLVLTTLAVVWVVVARRRFAPARAVVVTAIVAVLGLAVVRFDAWVVERVWDDAAGINSNEAVWSQLTKFASLPIAAIGQVWYLLVTTLGLVGVGAARLGRAVVQRTPGEPGPQRPPWPTRTDSAIVLGSILPLVALSIVFMADRPRPDQLVYGRYSDAVIGPVLVVGIAALLDARRSTAATHEVARDVVVIAAVVVSGGVVLAFTRGDDLADAVLRPMVLGLQPFTGDAVGVAVIRVTIVAVLAAAALTVLAVRARPAAVVAALVLLLLVGALRTDRAVDTSLNAWAVAADVRSLRGTVLAPGEPVRFKQVPPADDPAASWSSQRHRRMLYQFYLPENPMVMDGDPATDRLTPFVFAPARDPELLAAGAVVEWRDPGAAIALWRVPGP
jgi:hypothetical protein